MQVCLACPVRPFSHFPLPTRPTRKRPLFSCSLSLVTWSTPSAGLRTLWLSPFFIVRLPAAQRGGRRRSPSRHQKTSFSSLNQHPLLLTSLPAPDGPSYLQLLPSQVSRFAPTRGVIEVCSPVRRPPPAARDFGIKANARRRGGQGSGRISGELVKLRGQEQEQQLPAPCSSHPLPGRLFSTSKDQASLHPSALF